MSGLDPHGHNGPYVKVKIAKNFFKKINKINKTKQNKTKQNKKQNKTKQKQKKKQQQNKTKKKRVGCQQAIFCVQSKKMVCAS